MPEETNDVRSEIILQEAMNSAWLAIMDRVSELVGNALTPHQMEELGKLKEDYFRFWRKAQDDASYETELAVVRHRVQLLVTRVMLDTQSALVEATKAVLDVAADLAFALIQKLLVRA